MLLTYSRHQLSLICGAMFAEALLGACQGQRHTCSRLRSRKTSSCRYLTRPKLNIGTVGQPTSCGSDQGTHCLELHSVHAAGSPEAKGKADYVLELVDNISTWHNMTVGMLTLWRTVLERPSPSQQILHEVGS